MCEKLIARYDEYQTPCLEALQSAHESGRSTSLIVMAGGLGKTIVAAKDVQRFLATHPGKRVLFLCHDTGILAQNKAKFQDVIGEDYTCGFFIGIEKTFEEVDVLFASFQTMGSFKKWMHAFLEDEFAYIIVDEAHHAPAATYNAVLKYFKPEFLLGLTATPNREDGKPLSEIFGQPIYTLDFVEAWEQGYLTGVDYQLITDEMSGLSHYLDPSSHELISLKELNRKVFTPKRDEWIVEDIQKRIAHKKHPRMVIFCQSIRHAEHIAKLYPEAKVLHSNLPLDEQTENLANFRLGAIRTLVVVDKLNEGIDVPEIDVIVRLRLTGSATVFQQQLCRGLRVCDGKEDVLVLDYVSSCEHIENLFDIERLLNERRESKRTANHGHASEEEPRFVVTLTGNGFHAEKADIFALIKRARQHCYAKDFLISALQELAKELGRTPKCTDLDARPNIPSRIAYIAAFGSWNNALTASGLKPNVRYDWSDEQIISGIQELARVLGRTPTLDDVDESESLPNRSAISKRFGTWNNALRLAGLEVNHENRHPDNEYLIVKLQELAKSLGCVPSGTMLQDYPDMPSTSVYCKVFGSWNKALAAAGLEASRRPSYFDREAIIQKLQDLSKELGHSPIMKELSEKAKADRSFPSPAVCAHVFGTWQKAQLAAGLEKNVAHRYRWTKEGIIAALQRKAAELGRTPKERDISQGMPSMATCAKHFGSWNKALEAAGLK